ncbi:CsgE family curli-type amyloid fiber assembly protein [Dokdonia sp. Hel_I_53]|uniref:CsgE family curli-type amyloid fiber assembly protein n=1 Tax=Dokdonia sp. Hel_I_53 TaxID=1566287 RepID=UPI00119C2618|nr:CsgE family curli-type amyloid fiber assembly protein [Dokdonia sp. Hel_I_53]TVZ51730.1 Curli assembly protein CsgE [Dokdonia sp. Hel_I_53]
MNYTGKISFIIFFFSLGMQAQYFNKEVAASVRIERNSEFLKFFALAENKTPVDLVLEYDFLIFKTQEDGTVKKDNDKQRFTLKAYEKKVLQTLVLGNSVTNKTTLALLIYDKDGKPLGKDRIVLEEGSLSDITQFIERPAAFYSNDQSKPQDGFIMEGLVLQKTITKAGRDFHRYFYTLYFNKSIKSPKNILIEEVPGRSRTTLITVKLDNTLIWQFFSQPQRKFLEKQAEAAIGRLVQQLQLLAQQNKQLIQY